MGLNLQDKHRVVSKISTSIRNSLSAVVASLEGMSANEITSLRSICRKNNVYIYVIRNTLMCRAIKNTIFECLQDIFIGSNIIAFSTVDITDCIKIFVKFSKENVKFKIKGAVLGGEFFDESKVYVLSSLPNYKDCVINLMFLMRESTVGKFIRLLHVLSATKYKEI